MSKLTRASILVAFFFGVDKVVAFARSLIIARQFGLSIELDIFNIANNVPDLLFALISGGALAMAFIPVLAETRSLNGREQSWQLFSQIANLAFITTAILAVVVALLAGPIVRSRIGVAPGFGTEQQNVVINLMRLNLIATLIFSISGLVMAGLQANQHFLLPAMAPLFYNVGQIIGAVVFAPEAGYTVAGITIPSFGLGVYGLVYGVILGAVLHLGIQIPGLLLYKFRWNASLGLNTKPVRQVLALMGPRLATMFMIQLIFIVRDNLASRLPEGAVSSLTYGWMIMQVPETIIGTAIGIALLPTLSEMVAQGEREAFQATVERAMKVILAFTLPISILLSIGLPPLLHFAFNFGDEGTTLLVWVTRGFMIGLLGQCLMELMVRSFYARQDAITPLITAAINLVVFTLFGSVLYSVLGAAGISLADSISYTSQALLLLVLLNRRLIKRLSPGATVWRSLAAAAAGGLAVFFAIFLVGKIAGPVIASIAGLAVGSLIVLFFVRKEVRLLLRL